MQVLRLNFGNPFVCCDFSEVEDFSELQDSSELEDFSELQDSSELEDFSELQDSSGVQDFRKTVGKFCPTVFVDGFSGFRAIGGFQFCTENMYVLSRENYTISEGGISKAWTTGPAKPPVNGESEG